MTVVRPGTATPQAAILMQIDDSNEQDAKKENQVFSRSSVQGSLASLYDPLASTPSHKLFSATSAESSSHEGISGQEKVPFADEAIALEPGGVAIPMPGDDSGNLDRSERPRTMSASDQGKRPGLTRGRSHSGSSRRQGGRQTAQAQSPTYPLPNSQDSIRHLPGTPVGFQGSSQYQGSTSSPYDRRANYGGQYTMPPQSPMSMGHTPTQYPYARGFHPGGLHGLQDPNMLTPTVHPGYQQMLQSHGPVYPPYQRHSPEGASSSHSFPGGYSHSHVTPSPSPISCVSAQSPGPVGVPHSTRIGSPGQFHSLQFSGTISSTPYSSYTSQPFPSAAPIYQSQYAPSPYPPSFSPPNSDSEGQGTWWYLPRGVPPPSRPFEGVQPPYQAHFPMGYSQVGRRDSDVSYSPTGPRLPAAPASTPPITYLPVPVRPGVQQGSRSEQAVPSLSPAANERVSPVLTDEAESGVLATALPKPAAEHVVIRRHYHPNPPAQRSEWVMWAGNVPFDTVHDELWHFFKQPPSRSSTRSASPERNDTDDSLYDGVSSIFLISRSNCAFVNFDTEAHLNSAIKRFNGKPLRPNDPRCPRLVCRVRRKDDDLKAGVGGQRGMGIHTRWIKEKAPKVTVDDTSTPSTSETTSSADQLGPVIAAMSLSSDEEYSSARKKQSSSGSYASTNSSILTRYFPKRYFILKSLTQFDLDLSVEKGLWATQKHNEGILDQAYRTSAEVYLIFGVNKSGEFYGYARMAGPVLQGEHRVSWASRTTDSTPSSRSSLSPATGRVARYSEETASPGRLLRRMEQPIFFSPVENRLVEESPMPLTTPDIKQGNLDKQAEALADAQRKRTRAPDGRNLQSAPAELGPARRKFTTGTPQAKQSLGTDLIFDYPTVAEHISSGDQGLPDGFELDPEAPIRAQRNIGEGELPGAMPPPALHVVTEEEDDKPRGQTDVLVDDIEGVLKLDETEREGWGESFKIEWLCTNRLAFFRTRHLRNPWNHDREIKVSRDGTELEPGIGQQLLDEWESLAAEPAADMDREAAGAARRGPGVAASTSLSALAGPVTPGGKGESRRS